MITSGILSRLRSWPRLRFRGLQVIDSLKADYGITSTGVIGFWCVSALRLGSQLGWGSGSGSDEELGSQSELGQVCRPGFVSIRARTTSRSRRRGRHPESVMHGVAAHRHARGLPDRQMFQRCRRSRVPLMLRVWDSRLDSCLNVCVMLMRSWGGKFAAMLGTGDKVRGS
jgi:hypothetical protein